jgi:serine protease Do
MNTFLRLGSNTFLGMTVLGSLLLATSAGAAIGDGQFLSPIQDSPAYLFHSSKGYLGVDIRDVDSASTGSLKLKEARGAEIVRVDHDAPAGKSGLKVHDVIVEMNGQAIEGVEQLRRMLRETPAGRNVVLVVSRDGVPTTINVQLGDRAAVAQEAWDNLGRVPEPPPSMGFNATPGGGPGGLGGWFPGHSGSLHVGAVLNPVTPQLATYFGVKDGVGLLVASVEKNSPAAGAGLKAGDVVLKINQDAMTTRADWERVLRANIDKPVQITVVRDKKEQMLTMQPSSKKNPKRGELDWPGMPSRGEIDEMVASARELVPSLDPRAMQEEIRKSLRGVDTDAIRRQMEDLRQQMKDGFPGVTPEDLRDLQSLPDLTPLQPMD